MSMLGNFLGQVIKPVSNVAQPLLTDAQMFMQAGQPNAAKNFQPTLLPGQSNSDINSYLANNNDPHNLGGILGDSLQRTAGLGGTLMPFATGGLSIPGFALAGGLSGFGNSNLRDPGNVLTQTALGAGLGAGMGALTQGAGSVLKQLGSKLGNGAGGIATDAVENLGQDAEQAASKMAPKNFTDNPQYNDFINKMQNNPYNYDNLNSMQRISLSSEGRMNGLTYSPKASDFMGTFQNDVANLKGATNAMGKTFDGAGISSISPYVGQIRNSLIDQAPSSLVGSTSEANLTGLVDHLSSLPNYDPTKAQEVVQNALRPVLGDMRPSAGADGSIVSSGFNDQTISTKQLQTLAQDQNFTKATANVFKNGSGAAPLDQAKAYMQDYANKTLKDAIPGYGTINDLFSSSIRQRPSIVNALNNLTGSTTPTPRGLLGQFSPFLQKNASAAGFHLGSIFNGTNPGQQALGGLGKVLGSGGNIIGQGATTAGNTLQNPGLQAMLNALITNPVTNLNNQQH